MVSPISVLYYEYYQSQEDLQRKIEEYMNKIQCIVAEKAWHPQSIPFGKVQQPALWDYADEVDTLAFVNKLK